MSTYIEDIYKKLEEKENKVYSEKRVAEEVRKMLGDEEVNNIFTKLLKNYDIKYNNLEEELYVNPKVDDKDYDYFWVATKLIEMDNAEESPDGFTYPSHGWINNALCEELGLIVDELNRLHGVSCNSCALYPYGTCYNTKGFWTIDFDTVEDFNHFLWAGCFRYLPLSKSVTWRLMPNLGDPDYNEKRIRMELHYCDVNVKKEKILEDIKEFAEHIKKYADDEEKIKENLTKEL